MPVAPPPSGSWSGVPTQYRALSIEHPCNPLGPFEVPNAVQRDQAGKWNAGTATFFPLFDSSAHAMVAWSFVARTTSLGWCYVWLAQAANATSATMVCDLRSDNGGTPASGVLATVNVDVSVRQEPLGPFGTFGRAWRYSSDPALTIGTKYWITLSLSGGATYASNFGLRGQARWASYPGNTKQSPWPNGDPLGSVTLVGSGIGSLSQRYDPTLQPDAFGNTYNWRSMGEFRAGGAGIVTAGLGTQSGGPTFSVFGSPRDGQGVQLEDQMLVDDTVSGQPIIQNTGDPSWGEGDLAYSATFASFGLPYGSVGSDGTYVWIFNALGSGDDASGARWWAHRAKFATSLNIGEELARYRGEWNFGGSASGPEPAGNKRSARPILGVVRADGTFLVAYQGAVENVSGTNFRRVVWQVNDPSTGYRSLHTINAGVAVHNDVAQLLQDDSGRVHLFFTNSTSTTGSLFHMTIDTDDSVGSIGTIDTVAITSSTAGQTGNPIGFGTAFKTGVIIPYIRQSDGKPYTAFYPSDKTTTTPTTVALPYDATLPPGLIRGTETGAPGVPGALARYGNRLYFFLNVYDGTVDARGLGFTKSGIWWSVNDDSNPWTTYQPLFVACPMGSISANYIAGQGLIGIAFIGGPGSPIEPPWSRTNGASIANERFALAWFAYMTADTAAPPAAARRGWAAVIG